MAVAKKKVTAKKVAKKKVAKRGLCFKGTDQSNEKKLAKNDSLAIQSPQGLEILTSQGLMPR